MALELPKAAQFSGLLDVFEHRISQGHELREEGDIVLQAIGYCSPDLTEGERADLGDDLTLSLIVMDHLPNLQADIGGTQITIKPGSRAPTAPGVPLGRQAG
ncbi:MAG: hypothetical protein QW334_04265 [Thermofilum sp.]